MYVLMTENHAARQSSSEHHQRQRYAAEEPFVVVLSDTDKFITSQLVREEVKDINLKSKIGGILKISTTPYVKCYFKINKKKV